MKKLLLIFFLPLYVSAQNTISLPDVINYSKQSYNAGLQNWDIKQDKNGIIYIANNEGLLSFDSKYWNLYPLPNKTIMRSVEPGPNNKIYVGGQDELGYFSPDQNGKLQYHSLTQLIPVKDRSFGDVWDISILNKNVFFRSASRIFKFTNESFAVFKAQAEWSYAGVCNGIYYAHDFKTGLFSFGNDVMTPLPLKNILPVDNPVTAILSINKDSAIITTLKSGLYMLTNTEISKLASPNNSLFESERIYAACIINKERIAFASNNSGLYTCDFKGNIIQSFSRREGLQNNNVLSVFSDSQNNLWLGLDNGIDFIAYNSSIKEIKPLQLDGSGYAALIHNNRLYTGTTTGLYSVPLQPMADLSFNKENFEPVSNSKGQVWGLAEINNQLLMGHHEGAFVIKNNAAVKLSSDKGFWNFFPLSSTFPSAQIIGGNYSGLVFFDFINGQFLQSKYVADFTESSRLIAVDKEDNIWVSHPYHGIFRTYKRGNGTYKTETYTDLKGLPSTLNNHVFKVKNEVVAATEKGVYVYNPAKNIFESSTFYKKILGSQSIRYLKEDAAGNIWFVHEKTPGVIDFSGKQPSVIYFHELKNKLLSGFEFIYPVNENNIFLGGEKGFFHINYEKYKQTQPVAKVHIRTVRINYETDSLLFAGYYKEANTENATTAFIPELNHNWKNIQFEFSSSIYGQQSNLEYSFRLKGLNDNWSEWSVKTEKEYTNLSPGDYIFEVKVRNNFGKESAAASYSLKILPPWYQTLQAKMFYLLLFCLFNYVFYRWLRKKFRRQKEKYEAEKKRLLYIHDLEISKAESELVALRNEKLATEINFKNSELASSAMHLVKKGELLTKLKEGLAHMMKGLDNQQAAGELKKLLRTLTEDENLDKEWNSFSKYFDKVHSDFLVLLKDKHPAITASELKLCAYLRMNLSTKEIAQLMNISVRGVEIGRYRLRKKLQLPTETGLFDYLISLGEKNK